MSFVLGKVFDKKEYAEDFIKGKMRVMPLSYYQNIEGCRKDEQEGYAVRKIKFDYTKTWQSIPLLGNKNFGASIEALKRDGYIIDRDFFILYKVNCDVLCFTSFDENNLHRFSEIAHNAIQKGKYWCFITDANDFFSKLRKCDSEVVGDFVKYRDDLYPHPFVKPTKYSMENEFRFIFPNLHEESHLEIGDISSYTYLHELE